MPPVHPQGPYIGRTVESPPDVGKRGSLLVGSKIDPLSMHPRATRCIGLSDRFEYGSGADPQRVFDKAEVLVGRIHKVSGSNKIAFDNVVANPVD
jgi:hypothetical protein